MADQDEHWVEDEPRTGTAPAGSRLCRPGPLGLSITNVGEEPCRAALGEWR